MLDTTGHCGTSPIGVSRRRSETDAPESHTMLLLMDTFAQAVEDARLRLGVIEGKSVSGRELARRMGVAYSTLAYNLSPKRQAEGRRVSPMLIAALASVLPISEDELTRAAQIAAGYQTQSDELPDLGRAVTRYLSREDVTPEEKRRLTARLAEIVADEIRKNAGARNGE